MKAACVLCGAVGPDVKVRLVEWREPIDGERFSAIPRCQDHKGCRIRVEARGDKWELVA